MKRAIQQVVAGTRTQDGAGVQLVRVLGHDTVAAFDPFLMLDAFDSDNPQDYIRGFPMHPHRGIETVTYLIQGQISHRDSLGNHGVIQGGGCQWMTAGSGILHEEMPQPAPRMLGLQLWLNLPAAAKFTPPVYRDIRAQDVPAIHEDGCRILVIAGAYGGAAGPAIAGHVPLTMLDVALQPNGEWRLATPAAETVFIYLVEGSAAFAAGGEWVNGRRAVLMTPGEELLLRAGADGLRAILCMAKPLHEPVAWGGPIVMNTQQQLRQAFDELAQGTFIQH